MRCHQSQSVNASPDLQSHIRDKLETNNPYIRVLSNKWTFMNQPPISTTTSWSGQIGLGIHMSWVAQDILHSIYGKTAQLQITVYLTQIMRSHIKRSGIYHDCETVTYPVGIWEGTLTCSWWQEPICWYLAADKLLSIQGIADSKCVAIRAHFLDDIVNTPGCLNSTINGRR